jgi:peptidoglycan/xylan/chitin deacetylase (PgdA/CDA1 family)
VTDPLLRGGSIAADPNPIVVPGHSVLGVTTIRWTSTATDAVEVRVGAPDGPLVSRGASVGEATTGEWVRDRTIFYLQDVSGGLPLIADHTLATVQVKVRAAAGARALILLYHRVAELAADPWGLAVTPRHFAEQLDALRDYGRTVGLRQLTAALLDGTLENRSVAVTFDDGYADNLHAAKPLLERKDIPATVFVTTGAIGGTREFWWDELDRALLQPSQLPETLNLRISGHTYRWALGDAVQRDVHADQERRSWRAWDGSEPSARHSLYRAIYRLLYPLPEEQRRDAQDELLAWAGVPSFPARESHRALTHQEVIDLAAGELIEIGAHTVTHSLLAATSSSAQRYEILHSKIQLEQALGRPVTSFAYPFGKRGDYSDETISIVRESGFACACANAAGALGQGVDRFQLPRIYVLDWDGDEFIKQLSPWLQSSSG